MNYDLLEFERYYSAYLALFRIEEFNRSMYHKQYYNELKMRIEEMKPHMPVDEDDYPIFND